MTISKTSPQAPAIQIPSIQVEHLCKSFDDFHAVNDLSFSIQPGSVVGFIGANGAGKTTTMRIISTLEMPTSGRVLVGGHDVVNAPQEVRRQLGWMPDHFGKYKHLTVLEYLDFFARSYGFKGEERIQRVEGILAFTEMERFRSHMMDKLSKGLTQRMGLGRALIHDPQILILDEPAAGLDPKARVDLKKLIRILADEGKTLFISSHILSELEEMCDTMLFIDDGRLLHEGGAQQLKEEHETGELRSYRMEVKVLDDPKPLYRWCDHQPQVQLLEELRHGAVIKILGDEPSAKHHMLKNMLADGLEIVDFHESSKKLEDVFVDLLQDKGRGNAMGSDPQSKDQLLKRQTSHGDASQEQTGMHQTNQDQINQHQTGQSQTEELS
jgi:ABC-2 type transport system ATP-binding protein